jgi:hypothetical protein
VRPWWAWCQAPWERTGTPRRLRAIGHVVMPGPSRTRRRVWSRMTRGDTGVLPCRVAGGWRARCHGARGDARALPHRERVWSHEDMRRHRSPFLPGAESSTVRLDLSLVHRGTRSVGDQQNCEWSTTAAAWLGPAAQHVQRCRFVHHSRGAPPPGYGLADPMKFYKKMVFSNSL